MVELLCGLKKRMNLRTLNQLIIFQNQKHQSFSNGASKLYLDSKKKKICQFFIPFLKFVCMHNQWSYRLLMNTVNSHMDCECTQSAAVIQKGQKIKIKNDQFFFRLDYGLSAPFEENLCFLC